MYVSMYSSNLVQQRLLQWFWICSSKPCPMIIKNKAQTLADIKPSQVFVYIYI